MTHLHKLLRPLLVLMIAVSMVAPPFFMAATPRVEAQSGIAACILGWLGFTAPGLAYAALQYPIAGVNTILASLNFDLIPSAVDQSGDWGATGNTNAASNGSQTFKDCLLDALAWIAKNMIIPALTASIVDWINSGFEGGPTFIQDPQSFFVDMADYMAGQFIFEGGLEFLCSPFQIDVMISLAIDYYTPRGGAQGTLACTLSDVVANVEDFYAGNFEAGGFPGWFEMVVNPSNNPYGAMLAAQDTIALRINRKKVVETNLLSWAGGFFSSRDPETKKVSTPGTYIASQLEDWTGAPLAQLEVADELDEVLGALFTQLVQTILTGGLSDSSHDSGGGSYLDRIISERATQCETGGAELLTSIDSLIASETARGLTEFLVELNELRVRVAALDCEDPNYAASFAEIQGLFYGLEARIAARDSTLSVTVTATPTEGPAPLTVNFTATVNGGTPAPFTYAWTFGDVTTGTDNPASHTYSRPGTYLASVSVTAGPSRGVASVLVTVTGEGGTGTVPPTPTGPPSPPPPPPPPPPSIPLLPPQPPTSAP